MQAWGRRAARVLTELGCTARLLGSDLRAVPPMKLLRAQLAAHAIATLVPAGRAAGEGAKAALLAERVGVARGVAVGAAGQCATLLANAAFALFGLVFAWRAALPAAIQAAFFVYALLTGGAAAGLVLAGGRPGLVRRLGRWPALQASVQRFHRVAARDAPAMGGAIGFHLLGRACQPAQLAVLLVAAGSTATFVSTVLAQCSYMVGAAAGELVPAQLGATDGATTSCSPIGSCAPPTTSATWRPSSRASAGRSPAPTATTRAHSAPRCARSRPSAADPRS